MVKEILGSLYAGKVIVVPGGRVVHQVLVLGVPIIIVYLEYGKLVTHIHPFVLALGIRLPGVPVVIIPPLAVVEPYGRPPGAPVAAEVGIPGVAGIIGPVRIQPPVGRCADIKGKDVVLPVQGHRGIDGLEGLLRIPLLCVPDRAGHIYGVCELFLKT